MSASPISRKAATGLLNKPRGFGVGGPGDEGVERSTPGVALPQTPRHTQRWVLPLLASRLLFAWKVSATLKKLFVEQ